MILHHDREAFEELIAGAANELKIPAPIIEKDYYVTMALKELSKNVKDMVFRGGTSLTKCYQILDRFSEDIDISYTAESGAPGEARKRQLKRAVVSSVESIELSINNIDETRSRRNYNCYRAAYPSIYELSPVLRPELVIETYIAILPYPTVTRMVDNYLYRFLQKIGALHIAEEYSLTPFSITTQAMERTLIDKLFAICDYYMEGKTERHSRHLYDIHKIFTNLEISGEMRTLAQEVRSVRASLPICPSAKDEVNVNQILIEIIEKDVYKSDYYEITNGLLFRPLAYEETVETLRQIVKENIL